jgi:hypothetical protein
MNDISENAGKDNASADEATSQSQATGTPETSGQAVTGIKVDPQPEPPVKAGQADESASETQKETLDAIKKGERIALIIAAIVAVGTIGQWITTCQNNASTSAQIEKLITAANTQAGAAQQLVIASQRNAAAAESFSNSAASINGGMGNAVSKLQGQVEQTAQLASKADQANRIAQQAIESQIRPWIDASAGISQPIVIEPDGVAQVSTDVTIRNLGHSPAVNVTINVRPINDPPLINIIIAEERNICTQLEQANDSTRPGKTIFQDMPPETTTLITTISKEEMNKTIPEFGPYAETGFIPQVVGCVVYQSAGFPEYHHTPFFAMFAPKHPVIGMPGFFKRHETITADDIGKLSGHPWGLPPD